MLPNADFSISQQKLGVLRGCLEECGSTPHTIGSGRYFESHWKDGWNKVVEILEQVAARDQFLGYAEETRILLRCRRLLLTALDEDPHPRSEETRTIHVGIPALVTTGQSTTNKLGATTTEKCSRLSLTSRSCKKRGSRNSLKKPFQRHRASYLHRREHKVLGCTCSAGGSGDIPVHGAADIRVMDDRGHWLVFAIRLQLKSPRTWTCCSVTADIPGQRADNRRTCHFCFYFIFCVSYSRFVECPAAPVLVLENVPAAYQRPPFAHHCMFSSSARQIHSGHHD